MIPFIPPPQTGLVPHEGAVPAAAHKQSEDSDPFESAMSRAVDKHSRPPGTTSAQARTPGAVTSPPGKKGLASCLSPVAVSSRSPQPATSDPAAAGRPASPPTKARNGSEATAPPVGLDVLLALAIPAAANPVVVTARPEAAESTTTTPATSPAKDSSINQPSDIRPKVTSTPAKEAGPAIRVQASTQSESNAVQDSATKPPANSESGQGASTDIPPASGSNDQSDKKESPASPVDPAAGKKHAAAPVVDGTAQMVVSGRLPLPSTDHATRTKSTGPPTEPPPTCDTGKDCPDLVGTSAAQQDLPMKKAEKMLKTADLPQQDLPGEGALSAAKAVQTPSSTVQADPVSTLSTTAPVETRQLALERTHDMVAMHALRLTHSGGDNLRVVIEPGGGTRLSLELRFNNGGVEAQATLHRGDFEFLNQHWTELQQRLEPRGVLLGALENSGTSADDRQSPGNSARQSGEEPQNRSAFADFALNGPMTPVKAAPRVRTKTHPGWETWA